MSSYFFDNSEQGPPNDNQERILSPSINKVRHIFRVGAARLFHFPLSPLDSSFASIGNRLIYKLANTAPGVDSLFLEETLIFKIFLFYNNIMLYRYKVLAFP
jgi:hypothetical protein